MLMSDSPVPQSRKSYDRASLIYTTKPCTQEGMRWQLVGVVHWILGWKCTAALTALTRKDTYNLEGKLQQVLEIRVAEGLADSHGGFILRCVTLQLCDWASSFFCLSLPPLKNRDNCV